MPPSLPSSRATHYTIFKRAGPDLPSPCQSPDFPSRWERDSDIEIRRAGDRDSDIEIKALTRITKMVRQKYVLPISTYCHYVTLLNNCLSNYFRGNSDWRYVAVFFMRFFYKMMWSQKKDLESCNDYSNTKWEKMPLFVFFPLHRLYCYRLWSFWGLDLSFKKKIFFLNISLKFGYFLWFSHCHDFKAQ